MELNRILGTNNINNTKYNFVLHPTLYSNICFSYLNEEDIIRLKERKSYLRIFSIQETKDSDAYIDCYIREINKMIPCHKEEKDLIFSEYRDSSLILIEINYATKGFFFLFNINSKKSFNPHFYNNDFK